MATASSIIGKCPRTVDNWDVIWSTQTFDTHNDEFQRACQLMDALTSTVATMIRPCKLVYRIRTALIHEFEAQYFAMASSLRSLADLILTSVCAIEERCSKLAIAYPSLDEPFTPSSRWAHKDSEVASASALIASAAYQILCVVREPQVSLHLAAYSYQKTAALRTAAELHVAEILRDAGPSGLRAKDIAAKTDVDPSKLARLLRFLVTHHIFTEVSPDVFANNRISSLLDKGQPVEELLRNPERIYDKPESAHAAMVCFLADEEAKAASYLHETLTDPRTAHSSAASDAPFARAVVHTNPSLVSAGPLTFWDYLERENELERVVPGGRLRRFAVAMESLASEGVLAEVLQGFNWASLPHDALVVDVGGGVGAIAALITKANPWLRIVIQDRQNVIDEGYQRWQQTNIQALNVGRVRFQARDFFTPQQPHYAPVAVFVLSHIMHDWADEYASTILRHLRDSAVSSEASSASAGGATRLVILDMVLRYACRTSADTEAPTNKFNDVPANVSDTNGAANGITNGCGASENGNLDKQETKPASKADKDIATSLQPAAPAPLLPNMGGGNPIPYAMDMVMLTTLNSQERTLAQFDVLLRGAGWELVRVVQSSVVGEYFSMLEAVPL